VPTEIAIVTSRHVDSGPTLTFVGKPDDVRFSLTLTTESAEQLAEGLKQHVASLNEMR
jgi:hypothetical protein